jgi:hypothetical protein
MKLATLIVDKRKGFYLIFIVLCIFCVLSMNRVKVNNDLTTYLPDTTETRRGLDLMDSEFTTYGSARILICNVTFDEAQKLADQVEEMDGVSMLISIATISRRAKSVGVHKCSGASSGNIFGMFLAETGVLVLLSVLFSFLLIINMGELIEDLLGTSLASLFAWDIIWIPLLTVVVLFLLAGGIPGKLFSRIPVTQVFRHYTDGKRGWKRSLLFVQFTGTSFVLGLLLYWKDPRAI